MHPSEFQLLLLRELRLPVIRLALGASDGQTRIGAQAEKVDLELGEGSRMLKTECACRLHRHRQLEDREGERMNTEREPRWATAEDHYFKNEAPHSEFDFVVRVRRPGGTNNPVNVGWPLPVYAFQLSLNRLTAAWRLTPSAVAISAHECCSARALFTW